MSSEGKNYHARTIGTYVDPTLMRQELERVGAQKPGQEIIASKATTFLVELENLSCVTANVLKQEMLARGGDCAVHMDCVTLKREASNVLLTGNRTQYDDLASKLQRQGFGLPEVGRQLAELFANLDTQRKPLKLGSYSLPLGERTLLMGIINTTPDSFSGDGLGSDIEAAIEQGKRMAADGADILDVGGMSTRPGSEPVSVEEELRRIVPVIEGLAGAGLPISVDTNRAEVARHAVEAGATIINDISGLHNDPAIAGVAAESGAALVLMHMQGTPRTMQQHPHYNDLLGEIIAYLRVSIDRAVAAGVNKERIWVDPGIGFGKTVEHNLEVLRRLNELRSLGCPILIGTSRKAFIGRIIGEEGTPLPPQERVVGTGATLAVSIANGADIVRVHDVGHAAQVVRIADAIMRSKE